MTTRIDVRLDITNAVRRLDAASRKQVPFAAAQAINTLAFDVMRAERSAISGMFRNPRPFTQRGTVVQQKARKGRPEALVGLRPEVAAYLAPFEFGGLHHIPGKGMALLNPVNIRLDRGGQIRGKPSDIGSRPGVFVGSVNTKHGPVAGFWRRLKNHHLQLLIRFTRAKAVTQHLDFVARAEAQVKRDYASTFDDALKKALASKS